MNRKEKTVEKLHLECFKNPNFSYPGESDTPSPGPHIFIRRQFCGLCSCRPDDDMMAYIDLYLCIYLDT